MKTYLFLFALLFCTSSHAMIGYVPPTRTSGELDIDGIKHSIHIEFPVSDVMMADKQNLTFKRANFVHNNENNLNLIIAYNSQNHKFRLIIQNKEKEVFVDQDITGEKLVIPNWRDRSMQQYVCWENDCDTKNLNCTGYAIKNTALNLRLSLINYLKSNFTNLANEDNLDKIDLNEYNIILELPIEDVRLGKADGAVSTQGNAGNLDLIIGQHRETSKARLFIQNKQKEVLVNQDITDLKPILKAIDLGVDPSEVEKWVYWQNELSTVKGESFTRYAIKTSESVLRGQLIDHLQQDFTDTSNETHSVKMYEFEIEDLQVSTTNNETDFKSLDCKGQLFVRLDQTEKGLNYISIKDNKDLTKKIEQNILVSQKIIKPKKFDESYVCWQFTHIGVTKNYAVKISDPLLREKFTACLSITNPYVENHKKYNLEYQVEDVMMKKFGNPTFTRPAFAENKQGKLWVSLKNVERDWWPLMEFFEKENQKEKILHSSPMRSIKSITPPQNLEDYVCWEVIYYSDIEFSCAYAIKFSDQQNIDEFINCLNQEIREGDRIDLNLGTNLSPKSNQVVNDRPANIDLKDNPKSGGGSAKADAPSKNDVQADDKNQRDVSPEVKDGGKESSEVGLEGFQTGTKSVVDEDGAKEKSGDGGNIILFGGGALVIAGGIYALYANAKSTGQSKKQRGN
ncbi:MAG: hypothetical protein AAF380_01915 [Bacteroidota bacterium]